MGDKLPENPMPAWMKILIVALALPAAGLYGPFVKKRFPGLAVPGKAGKMFYQQASAGQNRRQ